jgi:hypothetical protein
LEAFVLNSNQIQSALTLDWEDEDLRGLSLRVCPQKRRVTLCVEGRRFLHRIIADRMGMVRGEVVEIINGNIFDLRRANLSSKSYRLAQMAERWPTGRTDQVGVTICRREGSYLASITHQRRNIFIGRFRDYDRACAAYREKDQELVKQGDRVDAQGWKIRCR